MISASSRRAVVGTIAASIAFVMELTVVPLLLPAIQQEFDLTLAELAWVFNAYGVAVGLGVLLGGWLGDVFNTNRVFVVGVLLFGAGCAVVASAGSFEVIVAGRLVQGFGGGVFTPLVPILLTRASPLRPGKILIVWGSIVGYVAAFAPLIISRTLESYGWQLAFIMFALISVVALITAFRSDLQSEVNEPAETPAGLSALLQARDLWLMFAYVFCTYGSITYFLFRLPLWMSDDGYDVTTIGAVLSTVWLSFSLVSTFLRNRVDGPHVRGIMITAPVLIAAGFSLGYYFGNLPAMFLAAFLIGSGLACGNAPSTHMVLKFAPRGMSAISASLDITFARLGGVAMVAWLAHSETDHSVLFITVIGLIALLCVRSCFRNAEP